MPAKPAGCATKMLTGVACNGPYPGPAQVLNAKDVLRNFAFVGLLEEWELSACVARLVFGGPLLPIELENVRPGQQGAAETARETKLKAQVRLLRAAGFHDPADTTMFQLAGDLLAAQANLLLGDGAAALMQRCGRGTVL